MLAYLVTLDDNVRANYPTLNLLKGRAAELGTTLQTRYLRIALDQLISERSVQDLERMGMMPIDGRGGLYREATPWMVELALEEVASAAKNSHPITSLPILDKIKPKDYPDIEFTPHLLLFATLFALHLPDALPGNKSVNLNEVLDGLNLARRVIFRIAGQAIMEEKGTKQKEGVSLPDDSVDLTRLIKEKNAADSVAVSKITRIFPILGEVDKLAHRVGKYFTQNQQLLSKSRQEPDSSGRPGTLPNFGEYSAQILTLTGASNLYTLNRRFQTMVKKRE